MEKPDIKTLGAKLGEELVKSVISEIVRPYAEYYILKSETKLDDIMLPFLQQLEDALVDMADKIHDDAEAAE